MEKVPKVVIFQPPQVGGELPVCDDAFFQWKKYGCNICDYRTAKRNHANRHVLKHNKRLGTVINSDSQIGSAAAAAAAQPQLINIQLCKNFKMFIVGPSGSGKTHFVTQLLTNLESIAEDPPKRVIYVFWRWQKKFDQLRHNNLVDVFLEGGTDLSVRMDDLLSRQRPNLSTLIIYDDQLLNYLNLGYIGGQFMAGRHINLSVVFLSQTIFTKGDALKLIRDNSDYYVMFKNPKNKLRGEH